MQTIISPKTTITVTVPVESKISEVEDIMAQVSTVCNVSKELICSRYKTVEITIARWLFWYILYNKGYTLAACGGFTGHDHTSVVNALQQIHYKIANNPEMKGCYQQLKHMCIYTPNNEPATV